jgi:hypothetical protein
MARNADTQIWEFGLIIDGLLKVAQLSRRKDDEEGLKQHDSFPEAGVEVIVARVYLMPAALRVSTQPLGKVVGRGAKVPFQIFDHFFEGADFVEELKSVGKKYPVQKPAHPRGALAPRPLIVLRIQRGGIWNSTVMSGVFV